MLLSQNCALMCPKHFTHKTWFMFCLKASRRRDLWFVSNWGTRVVWHYFVRRIMKTILGLLFYLTTISSHFLPAYLIKIAHSDDRPYSRRISGRKRQTIAEKYNKDPLYWWRFCPVLPGLTWNRIWKRPMEAVRQIMWRAWILTCKFHL
jgi:hypothetical protein